MYNNLKYIKYYYNMLSSINYNELSSLFETGAIKKGRTNVLPNLYIYILKNTFTFFFAFYYYCYYSYQTYVCSFHYY